jgi:hypothetical protein
MARFVAGKGLVALLGAALFVLSSCAGSSSYMKPAAERSPVPGGKAVVRFMRPSSLGFAVNINVLDGERTIGNSVAKSQFDYPADPGRHLFVAAAENQDYLEADLEAGKVYYVLTHVYPGFWRARVAFEPVTRDSKNWDAVLEYDSGLQRLQPDEAALKVWQDRYAQDAKAMVAEYENNPKKSEYPKLSRGDGR